MEWIPIKKNDKQVQVQSEENVKKVPVDLLIILILTLSWFFGSPTWVLGLPLSSKISLEYARNFLLSTKLE